jgi:hypothetical protein
MLQLPIAFRQRPMTDKQFGMKWYLPVTIGYDQVDDNNWLENVFEEELVTFSALPGFEAQLPLNEIWTIKPFGKLGGTYDFTRDEFITLGVLGLRTRATWPISDRSQFIWGGGIRLAGEYQLATYVSHGFSMGLKRPREVFGVTVERLRIGYKSGNGFRGWTVGTDFPI